MPKKASKKKAVSKKKVGRGGRPATRKAAGPVARRKKKALKRKPAHKKHPLPPEPEPAPMTEEPTGHSEDEPTPDVDVPPTSGSEVTETATV